jgi:Tfp pilus assembly protein PilO
MSRLPSEATQLRTARAEIKRLEAQLIEYKRAFENTRMRAVNAERERDEWKQRFDVLLRREPSTKGINL